MIGICGKKSYVAPEVLSATPVLNLLTADLWSLGVVLFMLVSGVPPVDTASDRDNRFRVITSGRLALLLQHWGLTHLSSSLVDLLQRLLSKVDNRIPLQEVITHPWVCGGEGEGWFAQAVADAAAVSATATGAGEATAGAAAESADAATAASAAATAAAHSVVDFGAMSTTTFMIDDTMLSTLGTMSVDMR